MRTNEYAAHELAKVSNFIVFTVVGEDEVHVSTWYGYDIEHVRVLTRLQARVAWRRHVAEGYALERTMKVSPLYLGLDRSRLPADVVAEARKALRG